MVGRRTPWSFVLAAAVAAGCGTTRMTDTQRAATEQLLISDAIDQAVSQLDFRILANKPVYFDPQFLDGSVDKGYVISSLRQHLLACGCKLQEDRAKATYVVEARAGSVGTDRHSLLIGIPQITVPSFLPGQPTQIPEIPFAKKTDQYGVAKVAVYAYNRNTGLPVWQSGVLAAVSSARDVWVAGAGPFQNGTIRRGTEFAGQPLPTLPLPLPPFIDRKEDEDDAPPHPVIKVTQAASWPEVVPPRPNVQRVSGILGATLTGNPLSAGVLLRAQAVEAPPAQPSPSTLPTLAPVPR